MARILVLSDIHGNLDALDKVIEDSGKWDEVVILGDLVDYGPSPGEVIDFARSAGALVLRGNHDHAVAYGVDCRCGEATHWLSLWFRENVTLRLLGEGDIRYLASLPTKVVKNWGGMTTVLTHAAPSNPLYAYLYPWLAEEEVCSLLSGSSLRIEGGARDDCPVGMFLVGHTHIQFYKTVNGAKIVNPGSVGQPRDGDPRASYMILDTDRGTVVLRRVKYDVQQVIARLEGLGVTGPYLEALRHILTFGTTRGLEEYARKATGI